MGDFNGWLGLRPIAGAVVFEATTDHEVAPGVIHFAVLTTLAEVAAARAVGVPVVPAQLSVSLLARASPGQLRGVGTLVRRGGRLAVATGEVFASGPEGERLVALATVTFALV